jgi:hypothetical protein
LRVNALVAYDQAARVLDIPPRQDSRPVKLAFDANMPDVRTFAKIHGQQVGRDTPPNRDVRFGNDEKTHRTCQPFDAFLNPEYDDIRTGSLVPWGGEKRKAPQLLSPQASLGQRHGWQYATHAWSFAALDFAAIESH